MLVVHVVGSKADRPVPDQTVPDPGKRRSWVVYLVVYVGCVIIVHLRLGKFVNRPPRRDPST